VWYICGRECPKDWPFHTLSQLPVISGAAENGESENFHLLAVRKISSRIFWSSIFYSLQLVLQNQSCIFRPLFSLGLRFPVLYFQSTRSLRSVETRESRSIARELIVFVTFSMDVGLSSSTVPENSAPMTMLLTTTTTKTLKSQLYHIVRVNELLIRDPSCRLYTGCFKKHIPSNTTVPNADRFSHFFHCHTCQ